MATFVRVLGNFNQPQIFSLPKHSISISSLFFCNFFSVISMAVLVWADVLAAYALWIMAKYLSDVWGLNVTDSAKILNIWGGIACIMPIGAAFLVDTFVGDYYMLLLSSISYSIGLGLLSLSTPPVTGSCKEYKSECIGEQQKNLFYIGLAFIAVGMSGHGVSLMSFFKKQQPGEGVEEVEADEWKWPLQCLGLCGVILVPVIGGIALPYINPWSVRFGIPAICTTVATVLFLSGSCTYRCSEPQGSPLTHVLRVFVASVSKMFHTSNHDADKLYEKRDSGLELVPHTHGLSCLDKAAIILPTPALEQQELQKWKLCRVTAVEETKISVRMVPLWSTLVICGVVSSIGNTYFLEQANKLDLKLGRIKVPLPILLLFYDMSKALSASIYFKFAGCFGSCAPKKYVPPVGIAVAMASSVICCIIAAKVETRRLNVITNHDLLDKPDDTIPMSVFWLLPQYFFLGALDGISDKSISTLFEQQAPPSMRSYLIYFSNGVKGLGIVGSVLTVSIAARVSKSGGKPSWFQETLNMSRLDKYYWTLAGMSAVNLVLYIVVAFCFNYRDSDSTDEAAPEIDPSPQPYEDAGCCC